MAQTAPIPPQTAMGKFGEWVLRRCTLRVPLISLTYVPHVVTLTPQRDDDNAHSQARARLNPVRVQTLPFPSLDLNAADTCHSQGARGSLRWHLWMAKQRDW